MTLQQGRGCLQLNGALHDLDADTCLPVNAGSRLALRLPGKDVAPAFLFFDSVLPGVIHRSLVEPDETLLEPAGPNTQPDLSFLEYPRSKDARLGESLRLLTRLGKSCSSFSALKADAIVRSILETLLLRNREAQRLSARLDVVKPATRLELFKRLSAARDWIEAHAEQNVSLNEMAGMASMNSQHFLRMFKQVYGSTPYRFLIRLKLDIAKKQIETGNESISDICHQLGYESLSTFSDLFRRQYGLSPTQWRRHAARRSMVSVNC